MEKTRKEIEDLKLQWESDGSWDLYHTDGFEEHFDELWEHQKNCEAKWEQQEKNKFEEFKRTVGTKNIKLSAYLYAMAHKIQKLEGELTVLKSLARGS